MDLTEKNVVITGASQGIGAKLAEHFSAAGANVMLIARSADKLAALAERLDGHWIEADLSEAANVDGLVDRCVDQLGHIDVWVNNAGVETQDAFANTQRDVIRVVARLNFEAPLMLTRDVLPHMVERGSGHIVQMSSVAGVIPFPGLTAYAGTKAGLTNFTESLRIELAGTGIGLTVVAPGPVDTAMWDRVEGADAYPAPALKRFRHLLFLPKVSPDKIAAATVAAVTKGERFVRIPARFGAYHMLNNAPRRMVAMALVGVKLPTVQPSEATVPDAT